MKTATRLAVDAAKDSVALEIVNTPTYGLAYWDIFTKHFQMYQRRIFRHELQRNMVLEREIQLAKSIDLHGEDPHICSYHQESVGWHYDGFSAKVFRKTYQAYCESKWPKPLHMDMRSNVDDLSCLIYRRQIRVF